MMLRFFLSLQFIFLPAALGMVLAAVGFILWAYMGGATIHGAWSFVSLSILDIVISLVIIRLFFDRFDFEVCMPRPWWNEVVVIQALVKLRILPQDIAEQAMYLCMRRVIQKKVKAWMRETGSSDKEALTLMPDVLKCLLATYDPNTFKAIGGEVASWTLHNP